VGAEVTRRKIKAALLAALAGLSAAAIAAVLFAFAATVIIAQSVKLSHPGDASAGDVAGWMIVILSPALVGADVVISLVLGFIAYRWVAARIV
jgi:hypothetical protein